MKCHNCKKGLVNLEELTISFGGTLSKPENTFVAKLHKVPDYEILFKEKYGSGNWTEGTRETKETVSNTFLVLREGICIGVIFSPYHNLGIKTNVYPIGFIPEKYILGKEIIEKEISCITSKK